MSEFARPRIRWSLVEKLDRLRGAVPRDRYITDVLEAHVENATAEPGGQAVSSGEGRSSRSKPVGAGSIPARPARRIKQIQPRPKSGS